MNNLYEHHWPMEGPGYIHPTLLLFWKSSICRQRCSGIGNTNLQILCIPECGVFVLANQMHRFVHIPLTCEHVFWWLPKNFLWPGSCPWANLLLNRIEYWWHYYKPSLEVLEWWSWLWCGWCVFLTTDCGLNRLGGHTPIIFIGRQIWSNHSESSLSCSCQIREFVEQFRYGGCQWAHLRAPKTSVGIIAKQVVARHWAGPNWHLSVGGCMHV